MSSGDVKPIVVFVDDEADLLAGLRNALRKERKRWDLRFALGGQAAIDLLDECSPDLVVSDMRMPGMNGVEVLAEVAERSPGSIRCILSGEAAPELALRAAAVAHQWLSKPCPMESLVRVMERALEMGQLVQDVGVRVTALGMRSLPPAPSVYASVIAAMGDQGSDLNRVAKEIERDPALAARVLQLTNSSFFGPRQVVHCVRQAVSNLGLRLVADVVLASEIFQRKVLGVEVPGEFVEDVAEHSRRVARLAGRMAKDLDVDVDTCGTAALLHDVGRLVLAASKEGGLERGSNGSSTERRERELARRGFTHGHLGAALLHGWGLPLGIVEAVAMHDDPEAVSTRELDHVGVVFLANAIDHGDALDEAWLGRLGLADRVEAWRAFHEGADDSTENAA